MAAAAGTRRRGEALLEAVYAAALEEIAEHGLRGASMDRIAHRAATGKAALYRRWPNVRALALDVFITTMESSQPSDHADSGCLRDDLLTSLIDFTASMRGPLGLVMRELMSEAAHDPSVVEEFQTRFGLPQQTLVVAQLQRAMARGEIPTRAVDSYILELPAAFVVHRMLISGGSPSEAECTHLIDEIVMPLLERQQ